MRERINVRAGRYREPLPSSFGWDNYEPSLSLVSGRPAERVSLSPLPDVESTSASDLQSTSYTGRIAELARKTLHALFSPNSPEKERHVEDGPSRGRVEARAGPGMAAPLQSAASALPTPRPSDASRCPTYAAEPGAQWPPATGRGSAVHFAGPQTVGDGGSAFGRSPVPQPVMPPPPPPQVAPLTSLADRVVPVTSNLTVYQFFNSTPQPQTALPPTWYARQPYSFADSRLSEAPPARSAVQYKRSRAQDVEVRALPAPSLRERYQRGPTSAEQEHGSAVPSPAPVAEVKPVAPASVARPAGEGFPTRAPASTNAFFTAPGTRNDVAAPAVAPSVSFAAPTAKTGLNAFVKAGPPAVMPDDDGFAPHSSDSDTEDKGATKTILDWGKRTRTEAPAAPAPSLAKTTFSFGAPAKPPAATFSVPPPQPQGTMANPFAAAASAPAVTEKADAPKPPNPFGSFAASTTAQPFGASATNSFVKAGPPAVMPDDDGFASGADDSDSDVGKKEPKTEQKPTAEPAKQSFSFGLSGGAGALGTTAGGPPNPFSFSRTENKPSAPAPAFAASSSTQSGFAASSSVNSFVKAGPPAVMPDDDGFAPDADDSDDNASGGNAPASTSEAREPQKPAFSFSAQPSSEATGSTEAPKAAFGFSFGGAGAFGKPADAPGAKANPFGSAWGNSSSTGGQVFSFTAKKP